MNTYQDLIAQIAHALQVESEDIEDLETPTDEYGSFVVSNRHYRYDVLGRGPAAGQLKPGSIQLVCAF